MAPYTRISEYAQTRQSRRPGRTGLKILSRQSGLHGYAIMAAIKDRSQDVLRTEEAHSTRHCFAWRRLVGFAKWTVKEFAQEARICELTNTGKLELSAIESPGEAVTFAVNRVLRTC